MTVTQVIPAVFSCLILVFYVVWNDKRLLKIPEAALYFSPKRISPTDARELADRLAASAPLSTKEVLPPKTGRRYIIVGGGGFLGAWIAAKLLQRGENPQNIRILDLHPPANYVVRDALAQGLQFVKVDVTDAAATDAAFKLPWSVSVPRTGISVFHAAANIRFFERHLELLDRSTKVNVEGTKNVVKAARGAGADVLVYTSSGAIGLHSTRLFLWPWEKEPENFVQVIDDDDSRYPKKHEEFFSNYAASKIQGERLIRASDKLLTGDSPGQVIRTGCIRPGNGVFGPRGDMNCGAWLVRRHNPSWAHNVVQSFNYVENCAAAHLCYEARLIELQSSTSNNPDIGGDAFVVADPGPPPTYGDLYTIMGTMTNDECTFPYVSTTALMLLAIIIETYYRFQQALVRKGSRLAKYFPAVKGDLMAIQPSIFPLVTTHMIFDDSRARLPPEEGGLGYTGLWTSAEGVHQTVEEFKSGVGLSDRRSNDAGFQLGFDKVRFWKAKKEGKGVELGTLSSAPMPGVIATNVSIKV
ncbi:hypothetical protein CPB83DRAFT_788989 [Crepidotus variabilis]|uniref:3-beta hydroxysteroid dehydrogenase/isomerase domain-containing protein n=1 Tax=Crepidotus variabilis TaxID=179855 RepID=A0A9P6EJ45_9AGAR|nr:hypothetical protein CPB83DRAFT_788989 [Crepidotus variabilis]